MIAFKLCRKYKDGTYGPLYVGTGDRWTLGAWVHAYPGERNADGKVISKLGGLAYRPGLHLTEVPYAPHIGKKNKAGKIVAMHDNTVWLVCEVEDTIDYTDLARRNGVKPNGKFDPRIACLDRIPDNGFYWYNTNPNAYGNWLITSAMRPMYELNDAQIVQICKIMGIENPLVHRKVA